MVTPFFPLWIPIICIILSREAQGQSKEGLEKHQRENDLSQGEDGWTELSKKSEPQLNEDAISRVQEEGSEEHTAVMIDDIKDTQKRIDEDKNWNKDGVTNLTAVKIEESKNETNLNRGDDKALADHISLITLSQIYSNSTFLAEVEKSLQRPTEEVVKSGDPSINATKIINAGSQDIADTGNRKHADGKNSEIIKEDTRVIASPFHLNTENIEGGEGWVPFVPHNLNAMEQQDERDERKLHNREWESTEIISNTYDEQNVGNGWMLYTPGGGLLDSRCPCLPRNLCPRAYGSSAADMLLLGHLPICSEASKVRCCGASITLVSDSGENADVEEEEKILLNKTFQKVGGNSSLSETSEIEDERIDSINSKNFSVDRVIATNLSTGIHNITAVFSTDTIEKENTTIGHDLKKMDEMSEKEINEYFRPDMLTFQEGHFSTLMEKSEEGELMIVTPVPLTATKKYQQQIRNMQGDDLEQESNSYIKFKNVMHVTHKPEKNLMIVTPQPPKEEFVQNDYGKFSTEQTIKDHKKSNSKAASLNELNSMNAKVDENENDQYLDFEAFDLLSQPSRKVEVYTTKESTENHRTESPKELKDVTNLNIRTTLANTSSMKEFKISSTVNSTSENEKVDNESPSEESYTKVNQGMQVKRLVTSNPILAQDGNRRIALRDSTKWSPMRLNKKPVDTNQSSFLSSGVNTKQSTSQQMRAEISKDSTKIESEEDEAVNNFNTNSFSTNQNLLPTERKNIEQVEASLRKPQSQVMRKISPVEGLVTRKLISTTETPLNVMTAPKEKPNPNPLSTEQVPQRIPIPHLGNIKHVIQVAPYPQSHLVNIHPVLVEVQEYPYVSSKIIPISNHVGFSNPHMESNIKGSSTSNNLGVKMVYNDPTKFEHLTANSRNREQGLLPIRNRLTSLYNNLRIWQASNSKHSPDQRHFNSENIANSQQKKPNSSTVKE